MMKEKRASCEALVAKALKIAKALKVDEAVVALSMDNGRTTMVRRGVVDSVELHQEKAFEVTVYSQKKKGTASTTEFSETAIDSCVSKAFEIAKNAEPDPFAGLPEKKELAQEIPDLDLYYPTSVSLEAAIALTKTCEQAGFDVDKRIVNSQGASFSSHERLSVLGNSLGLMASYPTTSYSLNCLLLAEEKGQMKREYDYSVARKFEDLLSPEIVGQKAAKKALDCLGARKINTQKAPVIFSADIANSLFGAFISAISGGRVYRKSSFVLDCLGKKVLPDFVHIQEFPHKKGHMGICPFDSEGVRCRDNVFVASGVLKNYALSSYSAKKLGLSTTGNAGGVHNLVVSTSTEDLHSLCKKMEKGLLVTEVMGHGVNLVTGDYSQGASGFWVENGKIQYPVEEITIAGNLKDMLLNLVAVGSDIDKRKNIKTGSVLLEEMTISGK